MRLAFILAFVSSVFFTTDLAEARSGGPSVVQARKGKKANKAHKRRAAGSTKAKRTSKREQVSRKEKVRTEEVKVADEEEAPAPPIEAATVVKHAPVAQTNDDEEPPSKPKKR